MRIVLVALAFLLVAVSGCADSGAKGPVDADEQKFEELDVDADSGAIRGIVLDPAVVPIEGATVQIQSLGLEAVSNVDGAFVFSDLEPGTYFLEAKKLGFSTAQTSVLVEAGVKTPPIVKIQLLADPSSLPFSQTFQYDGFMQCSFNLVAVGFNACGFASDVSGMDFGEALVRHPVAGVLDFAQTEMVWEGTQPLGDGLELMYSWDCGDTFLCDHQVSGPSILVLQADKTVLTEAVGETNELFVRVFGSESSAAPGTNLGATLEQEFSHYTNAFFGFTPAEGWMFIESGVHAAPT